MTLPSATLALSLAANVAAIPVVAQTTLPPVPSACKQSMPAPAAEPPAGSPAVLLFLEVCRAPTNTATPMEDILQQIRLQFVVSKPSRGQWTPFTLDVEQTISADLQRLRSQSSIAEATSEVKDYLFPNGAVGRVISYLIVDRDRN